MRMKLYYGIITDHCSTPPNPDLGALGTLEIKQTCSKIVAFQITEWPFPKPISLTGFPFYAGKPEVFLWPARPRRSPPQWSPVNSPFIQPTLATLASLLFLQQTKHIPSPGPYTCPFCLECCSPNHMVHSLNFCMSLHKYHLSNRSSCLPDLHLPSTCPLFYFIDGLTGLSIIYLHLFIIYFFSLDR